MPTADELYRRLGPAGVRQLNQLFTAGSFTEEEKEAYIQRMSQTIYQQQGAGGIGGLANLPDPQRGPIASSTPSYAPYGPSGGGGAPPPSEEIVRAPRPQGAPQKGGLDWAAGLATLGAGLQGMGRGGGGGNVAGVMIAEQRRRANEKSEMEERFLNQVDLMREEARLRRAGETEKGAAATAAAVQQHRAESAGLTRALEETQNEDERKGVLFLQRMVDAGNSLDSARKTFNETKADLHFEKATKDGVETLQAFSKKTGKPVGGAHQIVAGQPEQVRGAGEGFIARTPARPGSSGPLAEAPDLPGEKLQTLPPKPLQAKTDEDLDTSVRVLSNGEFQSAADPRVPAPMLAAAEQRAQQLKLARRPPGINLSIGEKADEKWAHTRVADLGPSDAIVKRSDLSTAPFDVKMPNVPSSEYALVRGEAGQKKLAAARESAKIVTILERAAAKMSDAPGANWGQAFQTYAAESVGQLGPLSDLRELQGLQMAVMRILGESGSQVSDMDMKRMDALFPKMGDGGPVARNKIGILREFAKGIKSSVLGEGIVDVPGFLSRAEEKLKTTPRKYNPATGRIE